MVVLLKKRMIVEKYPIVNEEVSEDNLMPRLGLI